jgi:uncharacterized SAM-binding protein YcdF (DUF218 family)
MTFWWLSPLSWLVLAMVPALLGVLHARRRRAWLSGAAAVVFLSLAAMTPIVANALVGAIEAGAEAPADGCDEVDALVLLSGGFDRAPRDDADFAALTPESLARLFAFASRMPARVPVLISGGGKYASAEATMLAELLRRLAPQAGTPVLETASRTTWDNAQQTRRLLPQARRIALATSALHLPRARRAFEAAGFEVCAQPLTSRYLAADGIGAWWPQASALRKSEAALHELAGDVYYRWKARGAGSTSS